MLSFCGHFLERVATAQFLQPALPDTSSKFMYTRNQTKNLQLTKNLISNLKSHLTTHSRCPLKKSKDHSGINGLYENIN